MTLGLGARGPWLGLVTSVLALGAIEVVVLHLLVGALLPAGWALVVDVVVGGLTVAFLVAFASPSGRLELVRAPSSPLALVELARSTSARVQMFRRVETTSILVGSDDAEALVTALRGGA